MRQKREVRDWGISEKGTGTREGRVGRVEGWEWGVCGGERMGGDEGEGGSAGTGRTEMCRWGGTEMERREAVAGQQHPQTCHFP